MNFLCNDCPRNCNIKRNIEQTLGFCNSYSIPAIIRAAPHFGEEPCISGSNGSGAIFFTGCNLRCSFCQNREISTKPCGKTLTPEQLSDLMHELEDSGVHNINLVTPTHFTRAIVKALEIAKLNIPVVWNSSAYEKVETLKMLDGLIDIYLPDYKYSDINLSKKYSMAKDYPEIAIKAISEMFRQRKNLIIDNNGLMKSGVIIRHLILPGYVDNSMNIIDTIADNFNTDSILFSLMCQFTPMPNCDIKIKVSNEENENLIHYMRLRQLKGYYQEICSATESYIPIFDNTGLEKF